MKCDEMQEFVSAMYDGEAVPPEAAEHFPQCATCQKLFRGFAEMGTELRHLGNCQSAISMPDRTWVQPKRTITNLWEKGWQMMKVPRIAFASLVLLLLVLGSRLALVEVRAHEDGPVLLLKVGLKSGDDIACSFSAVDEHLQQCGGTLGMPDGGSVGYLISFLKKDGNRALLSMRSSPGLVNAPMTAEQASALTETKLWVEAGKTADTSLGGVLDGKLTAQWTDHIPVTMGANEYIDPLANQLRVASPLLLKDHEVVCDLQGATATADERTGGVFLYLPGEGRFMMSLTPMTDSVAGKITENRISFTVGRNVYMMVTGAPVARGEAIWIRLDPSYTPPGNPHSGASLGAGPVSDR